MLIVFSAIVIFSLALLAVPVGMFCLEVAAAFLPRRRAGAPLLAGGSRVAVLVPAHNEQAVIRATIEWLLRHVPAGCRVLVVADNCSDATAAVARQCGAETIERFNSQRRGKGYALDFGIHHLTADPPQAVVFLDADCRVGPDTVRLLAAAAIETGRPVQGLNLCDPDPNGGPLQFVSALAFRFKNLVRVLGLTRLAGLNHLTGTGMALPWSLAKATDFAGGHVVEDMQLGIDLTIRNVPPLFIPIARVDSPLPQQRSAARTQRTRWEHGHLSTIGRQVPRLLWLALRKGRLDLLWLALDLAIPPLSLLVAGLAGVTVVSGIHAIISRSPVAISLAGGLWAMLTIAVVAGWAGFCRRQVPWQAVLAAPLYAAAKLPIYLTFVLHRQREWVRTARN